MSNLKVLLYCALSLVLALALCVVVGRAVMVPESRVQAAAIPQPVEAFQEPIDVGAGLGRIPVSALMEYFVAHPPRAGVGQSLPLPVDHFGGC